MQYQYIENLWRLAINQYDYIGNASEGNVVEGAAKCNNERIGESGYTGWIDLYAWATGNDPTVCNTGAIDFSKAVDWGTNPISNGGDQPNLWRTLETSEWLYIFYFRHNADKLFALATVNEVPGCVILPDDWQLPEEMKFVPSTSKKLTWETNCYINNTTDANNYTDNTYTKTQWETMERAGAVFLPVTGSRAGTTVTFLELPHLSPLAAYWAINTAAGYIGYLAFDGIYLCPAYLVKASDLGYYYGYAVRLVTEPSEEPEEAIDQISHNPSPLTAKRIANGHLYIHHGNQTFNAQGTRVK